MLVSVAVSVSLVRVDVNVEIRLSATLLGEIGLISMPYVVHPRGYRYRCRWPWRTQLRG